MAFTSQEEARLRVLLGNDNALNTLAQNEPAIIQELGAQDITIDDLPIATSIADSDKLIGRFGGRDEAVTISAIKEVTKTTEQDARLSELEKQKLTCLVHKTGSGAPHETVAAQIPASISINTRYVIPNPFGNNTPVICSVELLFNEKWADPGWAYTSPSAVYGVSAGYVQGEGVVIQSAKNHLIGSAADLGGVGGWTGSVTSAPCRVFVRKLEV